MKKLLSKFLWPIFIALLTVSTASYSFSYVTNLKNARLDQITTFIDAGAGAGKLEIGPTGMGSVCVTVTLNDPSAAAAASGVLTLSGFPKTVTASGACTAGEARIRDSSNNDVVTGLTVGTSGTNIIVTNTNIANGQSVTVNASPTFTHP